MGIIIPRDREALIKKYQNALFNNPTEPKSERIYVFYLLVRPLLDWLVDIIKSYDLNKAEIESELYIYTANLFNYYNPNKSSIIPYLKKYIPWTATHLVHKLNRQTLKEQLNNNYIPENYYCLDEEYYWNPNKILFEERYVGKRFTTGEKYAIYRILFLDSSELTTVNLAKELGVSRITMINKLKELQELEEFKQ